MQDVDGSTGAKSGARSALAKRLRKIGEEVDREVSLQKLQQSAESASHARRGDRHGGSSSMGTTSPRSTDFFGALGQRSGAGAGLVAPASRGAVSSYDVVHCPADVDGGPHSGDAWHSSAAAGASADQQRRTTIGIRHSGFLTPNRHTAAASRSRIGQHNIEGLGHGYFNGAPPRGSSAGAGGGSSGAYQSSFTPREGRSVGAASTTDAGQCDDFTFLTHLIKELEAKAETHEIAELDELQTLLSSFR